MLRRRQADVGGVRLAPSDEPAELGAEREQTRVVRVVQSGSRVHRLLMDPRRVNQSIASLAFEVGFGDLSYFNRAFKRFYGATPSEVRGNRHHGFDRFKNRV